MCKKVLFPAIAAVLLLSSSAAVAQSVSDLLETGIYTEETVGDLDAAMKIYAKIVADDKANRPIAAQALYRLGACRLKKGDKAEAAKTFEDLIERFPEQKQLVAKAREHVSGDLELLGVPWPDGEVLQMVVKLAAGMELGTFIYSADSVEVEGKKVWRLQCRRDIGAGANRAISRVLVDYDTFRPISSLFNHSLLGHFVADYTPERVTITNKTKGKGKESVRKVDLDHVVYDNEQGVHLFRRLPLAEGYKCKVPIFVTFGEGDLKLEAEVTAKEKVTVPAGQFECYKLDLNIGQTFWISTDAKRYPVKFEAGGVSVELSAIQPLDPNKYQDNEFGFSLEAPAGWYFYKETAAAKKAKTGVSILDPDAEAVSVLAAKKLDQFEPEQRASARALAEAMIPDCKQRLKDFKVREDSWQECKVSGRPAVSFLSDCVDGQRKMVVYGTCVLGESTASMFVVRIAPEQLDDFRKEFDRAIIDTYKVK